MTIGPIVPDGPRPEAARKVLVPNDLNCDYQIPASFTRGESPGGGPNKAALSSPSNHPHPNEVVLGGESPKTWSLDTFRPVGRRDCISSQISNVLDVWSRPAEAVFLRAHIFRGFRGFVFIRTFVSLRRLAIIRRLARLINIRCFRCT